MNTKSWRVLGLSKVATEVLVVGARKPVAIGPWPNKASYRAISVAIEVQDRLKDDQEVLL